MFQRSSFHSVQREATYAYPDAPQAGYRPERGGRSSDGYSGRSGGRRGGAPLAGPEGLPAEARYVTQPLPQRLGGHYPAQSREDRRSAAREAQYYRHESLRREGPERAKAKHERRARVRNHQIIFYSFLAYLLIGFLIFLVVPKHTTSVEEKRQLQTFPPLSWSQVFSGKWGHAFEAYVADQFPARQALIRVNQRWQYRFQNLFNWSGDQVQIVRRDRHEAQGAPAAGRGPQGGAAQLPAKDSQGNRQFPAAKPADQRPIMAQKPQGGEAAGDINYKTSSILIKGKQGMEVFYWGEDYTRAYAERIDRLRRDLPPSIRVASLVAPTAISFYGPKEYREGQHSQWDAIADIYKHLNPGILKVDAFSELAKHTNEYIYYRTDHHWNGRGAYCGYLASCRALGLIPEKLENMKETQPDGYFLGTIYTYSQKNPQLYNNADKAEIFTPPTKATITYYTDFKLDDPQPGVLLNAKFPQEYQYLLYSGGDVPVAVIRSEHKNGKRLLIIKDSYANALAPYFISNYEEIILVDPRAVKSGNLPQFIQQQKVNDVLVVNYAFAISNNLFLNGFDNLVPAQPATGTQPANGGHAPSQPGATRPAQGEPSQPTHAQPANPTHGKAKP